jgi:hypothetical protein
VYFSLTFLDRKGKIPKRMVASVPRIFLACTSREHKFDLSLSFQYFSFPTFLNYAVVVFILCIFVTAHEYA